jgi:hypothetical protein
MVVLLMMLMLMIVGGHYAAAAAIWRSSRSEGWNHFLKQFRSLNI